MRVITAETINALIGQKHALLVDDDLFALDINEVYLTDCGWTVHRSANVDEAAKVLLLQQIDLIIADFHMPDRTGDELFHLIQNFKLRPAFIFLSTDPTNPAITTLKETHQVEVWQKPIDAQYLYSRILNLFGVR